MVPVEQVPKKGLPAPVTDSMGLEPVEAAVEVATAVEEAMGASRANPVTRASLVAGPFEEQRFPKQI